MLKIALRYEKEGMEVIDIKKWILFGTVSTGMLLALIIGLITAPMPPKAVSATEVLFGVGNNQGHNFTEG